MPKAMAMPMANGIRPTARRILAGKVLMLTNRVYELVLLLVAALVLGTLS